MKVTSDSWSNIALMVKVRPSGDRTTTVAIANRTENDSSRAPTDDDIEIACNGSTGAMTASAWSGDASPLGPSSLRAECEEAFSFLEEAESWCSNE
ncbi:hypothetical protein PUN28_019171 [Cardiocondyla obscurior]|uniref:Uncharacterized protein n=1 Tax=Cardiocondyla obscurior TaxID=286306 RepID=A0AAW2EEM2_9HYME